MSWQDAEWFRGGGGFAIKVMRIMDFIKIEKKALCLVGEYVDVARFWRCQEEGKSSSLSKSTIFMK